jgi:hypothetical protein
LSPNPILRALSSIRKSGAKTLLMGGQACVFYGAAEFSRDLDLLLLADEPNLDRLRAALSSLLAEPIAIPALAAESLRRGLAVHFRCRREDVAGLRIDVMAVLRGVASFDELWARRTTIEVDGEEIDLLSLEDLVQSKKTQRDKDWPMIRRLVEQSFFTNDAEPRRVEFWLRELRTPDLLMRVAKEHPAAAGIVARERPAVSGAQIASVEQLELALAQEEIEERRNDRAYWDPLKQELEQLRRSRRREGSGQ